MLCTARRCRNRWKTAALSYHLFVFVSSFMQLKRQSSMLMREKTIKLEQDTYVGNHSNRGYDRKTYPLRMRIFRRPIPPFHYLFMFTILILFVWFAHRLHHIQIRECVCVCIEWPPARKCDAIISKCNSFMQ